MKIDTPLMLTRTVMRWHSEVGSPTLDVQHCIVTVSSAITAGAPRGTASRTFRTVFSFGRFGLVRGYWSLRRARVLLTFRQALARFHECLLSDWGAEHPCEYLRLVR